MKTSAAMRFLMDDVAEFHEAAGQVDPVEPVTSPEPALVRLRAKLIGEEVIETMAGMFVPEADVKELVRVWCEQVDRNVVKFDILQVADGIADLIYVAIGTALAFGIRLDRVWREVQRANMDKFLGGIKKRIDGKILKPIGWKPPDIHAAVFDEAA